MTRLPARLWILFLLLLGLPAGLLGAGDVRADPPEDASPSNEADSYTPAELAALDRALEAANLTRTDLTFRKDMAKGLACLASVRAMLHDPLRIAPTIDRLARDIRSGDAALHAPLGALLAAHDRVPHRGPSLATSFKDADGAVRKMLAQGARLPSAPGPTSDDLLGHLEGLLRGGGLPVQLRREMDGEAREALSFEDVRYRILRRYLPEQMAWHEVFASPYAPSIDKTLAKVLKAKGDAYVHDLASRLSVAAQVRWWITTFRDPVAWLEALPTSAFPRHKPLVKNTPYGRIALGTPGDDVYTGDYAALIDPGGNDRYEGCRLGAAYGTKNRRVGFFADLGGDDTYDCAEVNLTLGAAVLGIAAFFDLGAGNDRYQGGHGSLGAAMGGVAVFYDDGGSDTYAGRTFTQGAAGFGVGIFQDDAREAAPVMTADEGTKDPVDVRLFDNDHLSAWSSAQAFARCRGVALCINARGNDTYEAGGIYLDAPLFKDRYQSFSQGFAIGERGIDYAGGIALLMDGAGNDRYLGDIYNQGVGYWYSAGLLYDGGGNDLYEMTQYGQGSGIHLAVGGLVDEGGNDTYVMHAGLGQGGSHDFAASILHDRGGNDHYMGMTSCNGCGLTNAVGLHIDRSGDDTYAGRPGSINSGRPARGFASVGVLVDLSGRDDYLGIMKDATAWRHTDLGVGVDVAPKAEADGKAAANAPPKPKAGGPTAEVPAVCSYEGELMQAVFDELWAIAIRWQVGENRFIVPKARARLVAFGPAVLPYMDQAVAQGASGLELRAYKGILAGLTKAGAQEQVTAFLKSNLQQQSERRRKVALWLAGELKAKATEAEVVALLGSATGGLARRAAGVLQRIGSHAGDETLQGWIARDGDERRIMAALGTLLGLETPCYAKVRALLDHPLISVRSRLATLLAAHDGAYGKALRADLADATPPLTQRARRTVLDVLARMKQPLDEATRAAVAALLTNAAWGIRADAARVLQGQLAKKDLDAEARKKTEDVLAARLSDEKDAYVRFWLRAK